MTQQAVRRAKRGSGKSTALWRGLLLSIAATAAAVAVFALIISFFDIPDGLIRVINQVIKISAIFLGVYLVTPRGDSAGIRRGALLGLMYMGVGVLVYALLSQQKFTWLSYLTDVLMGIAAGGLSGMLLGSLRAK
ncbi:MAG: TIGR04086 family membrane protein [Clostridia bacterium]|nr:TIGR04086 family membrane protein [Clostridia bacterium]